RSWTSAMYSDRHMNSGAISCSPIPTPTTFLSKDNWRVGFFCVLVTFSFVTCNIQALCYHQSAHIEFRLLREALRATQLPELQQPAPQAYLGALLLGPLFYPRGLFAFAASIASTAASLRSHHRRTRLSSRLASAFFLSQSSSCCGNALMRAFQASRHRFAAK